MAYWWVNQSNRYRIERAGDHLFCPTHDKSGKRQAFYSNMKLLEVGDVCLNYAAPKLLSYCTVTAPAVEAERPRRQDENSRERNVAGLDSPGYLIRVTYHDLAQAIHRDDIPLAWRTPEAGAFYGGKWHGRPRMGYLWPLTESFVADLENHFSVTIKPG